MLRIERQGLEKRRLAERKALKQKLAMLRRRRVGLIETCKYDPDRQTRKRAADNLKSVDDRIRTVELILERTTRKAARDLADRIDKGAPLSHQSGNLPKVTWGKPWRG